jgi:hypothetical protein
MLVITRREGEEALGDMVVFIGSADSLSKVLGVFAEGAPGEVAATGNQAGPS